MREPALALHLNTHEQGAQMLTRLFCAQPLIEVALEDSNAMVDELADEQHSLFGALVAQLADEVSSIFRTTSFACVQ